MITEDGLSVASFESSSAGDDYVVVSADPNQMRSNGDCNDLSHAVMTTNLNDIDNVAIPLKMLNQSNLENVTNVMPSSQSVDALTVEILAEDEPGHDRSSSIPIHLMSNCAFFNGITYLGCASLNAPRSELEINRSMSVINGQSKSAIPIVLSIPTSSEGCTRLLDPVNHTEIASFPICNTLACMRGPPDGAERLCFTFVCNHGSSVDTAIYQCHIFRCDIFDAVGRVLHCFGTTFHYTALPAKTLLGASQSTSDPNAIEKLVFTVCLDLKEDDGKGNYSSCPKDKDVFKLRVNAEKRLAITVQHSGSRSLWIDRCFGLLISPGRNVKHSEMQLIELVNMGYGQDDRTYNISGYWDPTVKCFQILNTETEKDMRVFFTTAIDLVISGIQQPVRFAIETRAKIYSANERFWQLTKKIHSERFYVSLKAVMDGSGGRQYDVVSVVSHSERSRKVPLGRCNVAPNGKAVTGAEDEETDCDEPLVSGSFSVSKDIKDGNILDAWAEVMCRWHASLDSRPRQVTELVRKGIPEALRGEVWLLLSGTRDNQQLLESYRILLTKESPSEAVIQRDLNRTFPAHEFFRDTGGEGQDALYRISKMPEEQAFCVLKKIMFDYGMRSLFLQGFEELHLKFYLLDRLIQERLSDLHEHFDSIGVEVHMFASQWFLTLYTAKFPLHVVFHILDIYLSEGSLMIFSVALALLMICCKELLTYDFEGVLKYFRVHLPKRFRSEEAALELIQTSVSIKVADKKIKKYEAEYRNRKHQQPEEDQLDWYNRENKQLMENCMRLEQENDDLARELVETSLVLRSELDMLQDKMHQTDGELSRTAKALCDVEDEKKRLEDESVQLKELCRRELERVEHENSRNTAIVADYKQICSQLSERLEAWGKTNRDELFKLMEQVKGCSVCSALLEQDPDGGGAARVTEEQEGRPAAGNLTLKKQVHVLELDLAETKLALVECECCKQDLTHQLNSALCELQASKNTWFHKTVSSIRDAAHTRKDTKD